MKISSTLPFRSGSHCAEYPLPLCVSTPYSGVSRSGGTMRTKPCLTAADVKKMLAACEAEATKNKWSVSISIVDDGGFLLGALRMDGASAITSEVSLGKAKTSAMTRRPSKFFEDRLKERPA